MPMSDSAAPTARDARRHLQRRIDDQIAERSDEMYIGDRKTIRQLGRTAADPGVFGERPSQMNKLERLALSASTYGAIADYIKSQMGRDTETGEVWSRKFGGDLLGKLREHVKAASGDADTLLSSLDDPHVEGLQSEDEDLAETKDRLQQTIARRLRVGYAQAFVGHVVAEYNYQSSVEN